MKVVVGNRGSGVTTNMLLDAAYHGGTIITSTWGQRFNMEAHAKKFGIDCPDIIDIYSVLNDIKNGKTEKYDNVQLYVDNAGLVLNRLLSEIGIHTQADFNNLAFDANFAQQSI